MKLKGSNFQINRIRENVLIFQVTIIVFSTLDEVGTSIYDSLGKIQRMIHSGSVIVDTTLVSMYA